MPSPLVSACVHLAWASPAASLELLEAELLALLAWSASMLEEELAVSVLLLPYVDEAVGAFTLDPLPVTSRLVVVEFVVVTSVCCLLC